MQPVSPQPRFEEPLEPVRRTWRHKLGILLFIILSFEVGLFLLIFPWMQRWDANLIAGLAPWMRDIWDSPYFRGALSGLGLLNIFISLGEVVRLRRPPADRLRVSLP
jgi:hypothetical protein